MDSQEQALRCGRDAVAKRFGEPSWEGLIATLRGHRIIKSPGWPKDDVLTPVWHQVRCEEGLVVLHRRDGAFVGCPQAFAPSELQADRLIEPGHYDGSGGMFIHAINSTGPFSLPPHTYTDLTVGRMQIAVVIAIGGLGAVIASALLAPLRPLSAVFLVLGLWLMGVAWTQFGDIMADRTGAQPRWSIRVVAEWLPLQWFGPDRNAKE